MSFFPWFSFTQIKAIFEVGEFGAWRTLGALVKRAEAAESWMSDQRLFPITIDRFAPYLDHFSGGSLVATRSTSPGSSVVHFGPTIRRSQRAPRSHSDPLSESLFSPNKLGKHRFFFFNRRVKQHFRPPWHCVLCKHNTSNDPCSRCKCATAKSVQSDYKCTIGLKVQK